MQSLLSNQELRDALAAPFDPAEIKFKPQAVANGKAMAVPYIDARVVMDRLDEVFGVAGWQDSYQMSPDGTVLCRLQVRVGGEWVCKEDVGSQSEQPDEGDRTKAAYSDSLKRAAVKLGIGRYLYRQKPQWVEYDPQKKRFLKQPTLPVPPQTRAQAKPQPQQPQQSQQLQQAQYGCGNVVVDRVEAYEGRLIAEGLCTEGELADFVVETLGREFPPPMTSWTEKSLPRVQEVCVTFQRQRRQQANLATAREALHQASAPAPV